METALTFSNPTANLGVRCDSYYEGSANYQARRHEQWRENYQLFRDIVITNRLTQRQSVNVPLMKETLKTVLSKIDESTDLYFENLASDKQKEIFLNEYWKYTTEQDNFEAKDIVDKKQVLLYGRSTIKLNIYDGRVTFEVMEPYDWIVDRWADPSDIEGTAMYMCHRNIKRTIGQLESNSLYEKAKLGELRREYAQTMGLKLDDQRIADAMAAGRRLEDLGVWDSNNPAVGQQLVEVREHYVKLWDAEKKRMRIWLRITAGGKEVMAKPLEDVLGINFFPFVSWADDIERTDIYSDGLADVCRTPNKIVNSWFSSLVENRQLKNYGMHFYDNSQGDGKWIPQSYDPAPWAWIPVYGDPNKTTRSVDIPDLSDSLDELNFVIGMVERATAATATDKGSKEAGTVTLGQIQIMLAASQERITSISKFYRLARKELGEKWYMLAEANEKRLKPVELFKKSYKDKYFRQKVEVKDWKEEAGYICRVITSAEREQKTITAIQRMKAVQQDFPNNIPLRTIIQKRELDLIDLSAQEIDEVIAFEEEQAKKVPDMTTLANPSPDGSPPAPPIPSPVPGAPTEAPVTA